MPAALPNVTGDSFVLSEAILQNGYHASATSPRRRVILPLHRTQSATVQRMLNFFQPGTYVCPHQHPKPGAVETVHVLRGELGFLLFDAAGNVQSALRLAPGGAGLIDIEPRVWHGMVALEPDTAVLEIKQGPYDPSGDKVFAPWAPAEGSPEAEPYLRSVEALFAQT